MPAPMPPQGPPPQSPAGASPPPNQPPQNAGGPAPGAQEDPGGQSPAMKAVSMANDGLMQLGTIFESSKGQVSPQEQKQLATIITQFQELVASLGGEKSPEQPAPKPPGGPMPAMAGKGSTPMDQG